MHNIYTINIYIFYPNLKKMEGEVKFFNHTKGFGFIKSKEDEKEYFFHISGVLSGKDPEDEDKVTFDLEKDEKGHKAVNVVVVGE